MGGGSEGLEEVISGIGVRVPVGAGGDWVIILCVFRAGEVEWG
jgi:hypothetical protein